MEKAVKSILSKDKKLRNTSLTIDIDVTKNEVTLSGTVDSEAVRGKALELAKTAQVGVVITVKQGQSKNSGGN